MASKYYCGAILAATIASSSISAEVQAAERELHGGWSSGWDNDGWSSSSSGKSGKSGGSSSGKSGKGSSSSSSHDHWGPPPSWYGGWDSSSSSSGKSGKSGGSKGSKGSSSSVDSWGPPPSWYGGWDSSSSSSGKSGKSGGSKGSKGSSSSDDHKWHGGWGRPGWWGPAASSSSSGKSGKGSKGSSSSHDGYWGGPPAWYGDWHSSSSSGKSGKSGGGSSKGSKGSSSSDDHGYWGPPPSWYGGWASSSSSSGKSGKSGGGSSKGSKGSSSSDDHGWGYWGPPPSWHGGWPGSSSSGKSGKSKSGKGSKGSSSSDDHGKWVWVSWDNDGWDNDGWSSSSSGKSGKSGGSSGSGKSGKGSSSGGDGWEGTDGGKWADDDEGWTAPPAVPDPIYSKGGVVGGWKDDGWDNDGHYKADILYVRSEVKRLIEESERELIPKFLRLGFHDCVGECDGCVDLTNRDNTGLKEPIEAIYPIVDKFKESYSRADIWALATLVAADMALIEDRPADIVFPMHYIGRKDCSGADAMGVGGPDVEMPSNDFTTHELLDFFEKNFGFDTDETVVIMGVHAVAVAHRDNIGFGNVGKEDGWVFEAESYVLNNRYYSMLVGDGDYVNSAPDWEMELVHNENGVPSRYQWYHEKDGEDERPIMTNSDMALVRDLSDHMSADAQGNEGLVDCTFKGAASEGNTYTRRRKLESNKMAACPVASHTIEKMVELKMDNVMFLYEFEKVLKKMVKNGY